LPGCRSYAQVPFRNPAHQTSISINIMSIEEGDIQSNQPFASVWDAIEDTPQEAENMKLRSALMTALKDHLTRTEMSQAQAAELLGVTQPRVSDLMRGKINLFDLNALVNMATAAGIKAE
jgi:predicted XRE-type DNA-binding protein